MKHLCLALCLIIVLAGCQKQLTSKDEMNTAVVASDANSPLNCHSLTFSSDYPVKPGEVPPFSFTKTQYPDARIRTIKMLSRRYPIHPAFPKQAVELTGTFTYAANTVVSPIQAPHLAFLTGTKEVWEYYKTSTGAGARRSISKQKINFKFYLTSNGYCNEVESLDGDTTRFPFDKAFSILSIGYLQQIPKYNYPMVIANLSNRQFDNISLYDASFDELGNLVELSGVSGFSITYDYNKPRGSQNFSFIPSQNLISQEFSLLEVMQWMPQPTHQRKSASGMFYPPNSDFTVQSQVYQNYQFDSKGNQTSLTYWDNIKQRTTWSCQH